mmetsp:Transcript_42990/g.96786  ORF Transcript_42990/g.96786 Transcript_42990/m.96786 type:complete len:748 (-) Transcript_42990:201-2444(-)
MCRLRAAANQALNVAHNLQEVGHEANTILHNQPVPHATSYICETSKIYEGCFRFQAAHYPGHFLAYSKPNQFKLIPVVEETDDVICDFILLNYETMWKYMTIEEVLTPVITDYQLVEKCGVFLDDLIKNDSVRTYFAQVRGEELWDLEGWEMFFGAHFDTFAYDTSTRRVRLLTPAEQLDKRLTACRDAKAVADVIAQAGSELGELPLSSLLRLAGTLVDFAPSAGDISAMVSVTAGKKKVVGMVPKALGVLEAAGKLNITVVLQAFRASQALTADFTTADDQRKKDDCFLNLAKSIKTLLEAGSTYPVSLLYPFFALPTLAAEGKLLFTQCEKDLAVLDPPELVEHFHKAVAANAHGFAEAAGPHIVSSIEKFPAEKQGELLVACAAYDTCRKAAVEKIVGGKDIPTEFVGKFLLAVANKTLEEEDLVSVVGLVAASKVTRMDPETVVGLIVLATKKPPVAPILEKCIKAANDLLAGWSMDTTAKVVLACVASPAARGISGDLFETAAEVLEPSLGNLSIPQLIKVILAYSKLGDATKKFLEAAANEAVQRVSEIPPAQLVLVLQSVVALGAQSDVCLNLVEFLTTRWQEKLKADKEPDGDEVTKQRLAMERNWRLEPDHMAKLLGIVASNGMTGPIVDNFVATYGKEVDRKVSRLSDASLASVETSFASPELAKWSGTAELLSRVKRAKERAARSKSRSRSRRRSKGRDDKKESNGRDRTERPRDDRRRSRSRRRGRSRSRDRRR